MIYFRTLGKEFLTNGPQKLRVTTMDVRPSPATPGRVLRILVVNEVLVTTDTNSITHGAAIALSFPSEKINAQSYRWKVEDPNEECMVPIRIKLNQTPK